MDDRSRTPGALRNVRAAVYKGERSIMREVSIRNRPDGVTELSPRLAMLDRGDRWLVIVTVTITAVGFFTAGAMPAPVLAAVLASCVAGEVVLGAKAVVLALLRPRAEVHEFASFRPRRRVR
jgi:hypothetical protein